MMPALLQVLRKTNHLLTSYFEIIALRHAQSAAVTPEQMASLLSALLSAGAVLRAQALPVPGVDRELDLEVSQYRRNVERLRDFLPAIHKHLLAERARIEAQQSRLRTAAEWAEASRQTL
jgi:hypothetical protein